MYVREPTAASQRLAQLEQAGAAPGPEVPASTEPGGEVQGPGAVGGRGVPERERPDTGTERRPGAERSDNPPEPLPLDDQEKVYPKLERRQEILDLLSEWGSKRRPQA
jgi:hypothetical protein